MGKNLRKRTGTNIGVAAVNVVGNSVPENAEIPTKVCTCSIVNGSGTYTFALTDSAGVKFALSNATATTVDIETAVSLDFETAIQHQVTLEADNGVDAPIIKIITINVTDVVEGGGGTIDTLTQYGITAIIDAGPVVGQFWSGDYYVVGAYRLRTTNPAWNGSMHGAMINPVSGIQGFDSRIWPSLNVPFSNSVRLDIPADGSGVVINPGQSVILTRSADVLHGVGGGNLTWIKSQMVITCLASAPASPSTTFRPPFCGTSKPLYTFADVDFDLLLDLGALPAAFRPEWVPGVAAVFPELAPLPSADPKIMGAHRLLAPWVDIGPITWGHYARPNDNMPVYGIEMARHVSMMLACMSLDHPDKIFLAKCLIQNGIDLVEQSKVIGGSWAGAGGHGFGRKAPCVFAKFMLGAAASGMVIPEFAVGASGVKKFSEDSFFAYGVPTGPFPGGKPLYGDPQASPAGSNNISRDGNGLLHGGAAESSYGDWGGWYDTLEAPFTSGTWQGVDGLQTFPPGTPKGGAYRETTSPVLVLQALVLDLMGAKATWGHDAFFDYVRYVWRAEPRYWKPGRQPPNWYTNGSNSSHGAEDSAMGGTNIPVGANSFARWFMNTHGW